MKKKLKNLSLRLLKNQLIQGSATLFVGNMLANFGNYVYHLLMGRMLGPSDYGALVSVVSLVYIFGIPLTGLNLVIVRKVSSLRGKKQEKKIAGFYQQLNYKVFWIGLTGISLLFLISPLIKNFLHLNSLLPILIMIGFSFVGIFLGINLAIIRAFLKFFQISLINIFQTAVKLMAAVFLVSLGLSVLGASTGFLIGSVIAFLFSLFYLRKILKKNNQERNGFGLGSLVKEMTPFFIATLSFTSLYTADIVLARHFLDTKEAGFYSALATLGKIIFFASGPVITAMFPIITNRHASGKAHKKLFFMSLILVFLICLSISGLYSLFPKLMVKILFGFEYLESAKYLGFFGIFLSFYSLSNLITQFFLSTLKNKIVFWPFLAAVSQILLIFLFHQSLTQIVWVSIITCGLLFIFLLVYFLMNLDYFK